MKSAAAVVPRALRTIERWPDSQRILERATRIKRAVARNVSHLSDPLPRGMQSGGDSLQSGHSSELRSR